MNQMHPTLKIAALRRSHRVLESQIKSRTAELEKVNQSLRDEIAELKRAEKELKPELHTKSAWTGESVGDSEKRYRLMADATPVLIWQAGPDKLCTYFNKRWLEFTGRSLEQELGNGWTEGVHPDDFQRCLDTYVCAFDRREPFTIEYRLRHRSGEYHWVLDHGVPQFSSDGTFLGYVGGAMDTHDRKLAEQALREREEQLRRTLEFNQAVVANMAEGLYTLDTRGRVTYMNAAAERLFGWSSAELLGKKMHDMIHYQHADGTPFAADDCAGLQVLQNGTSLSDYEEVFIRKDRTFFPVVYSSSPIRSGEGIVGLVVVFRDMTAQKQTEEALQRSRQELRGLAARLQAAREEERGRLAREIHDTLSGNLTALKMDLSLLPDRAAESHDLFLEKLRAMSGLIDRTLARIQSIATELRPVVLDRLGIVAAVEWQIGRFQERSRIVCDAHLPSEEIPLDQHRSIAIFRILQEALTNVARHAQATKVEVDLRSDAGSVILTVRDNGKGIDEKLIFDQKAFGLLGMRERALSFGGVTEVKAVPTGGTLVTVKIPTK